MADQPAVPLASPPSVVVLGGGISGISAALRLLEAGFPVTLVEARNFLGGRAFSYSGGPDGEQVDNGQHVIVGCCQTFRDFVQRLGVQDRWYLQPRLHLPVLDRSSKTGALKTAFWMRSPFHLLPSFLTYPHLGLADKLKVLMVLIKAKVTDRSRPELEEITFLDWLQRQGGESPRSVQNFWDLLVKPTLNDGVHEVSAAMGLMIVQDGMLGGYHDANLGYPRSGLSRAIGKPAYERLTALDCQVRSGSPVKTLEGDPQGISQVQLASGERLSGVVFLSALPPDALLSVLPPSLATAPFFEKLAGIETSPIVNVHLWYDRPVMEEPFCALVDSPLQWVFNQTRNHDTDPAPTAHHVCISVSAAWEYINQPREELAETFAREMAEVFPAARDAEILQSQVVKQRDATFRCLPGVNRLRPGPVTPVPNLFLAGEWTATGWPSTMEGAVRSGYAAARAIFAAHSPPAPAS